MINTQWYAGQGHRGLKCVKMANFKAYLLLQCACNQKTICKF